MPTHPTYHLALMMSHPFPGQTVLLPDAAAVRIRGPRGELRTEVTSPREKRSRARGKAGGDAFSTGLIEKSPKAGCYSK